MRNAANFNVESRSARPNELRRKSFRGLPAIAVSLALLLLASGCAADTDDSADNVAQTETSEGSELGADGATEERPNADGEGSGTSCAESQDLVYAFITGPESGYGVGGDAFEEYLDQNAPGCFEFEAFGGRQLGDELEILQGIEAGSIQLGVGAFTLESFVPATAILLTPFVFRDRAHVYDVVDGEIGADISQRIETESPFKVLGYYTAGTRHILSTRPVRAQEDLEGLRLRVGQSRVQAAIWEQIGVSPVELALGDMFTAMETGTIDAVEFDPANTINLGLHEVGTHYTLTSHMTPAAPLLISAQFFDSLPSELQDVLLRAGDAATAAERAYDEEEGEMALIAMEEDHGIEIIPFDNSVLAEQARAVFDRFPEQIPPDLLERILDVDS